MEAKKLKLRMQKYQQDANAVLVHPNERKQLEQKVADLPELESTYNQVRLIEQKRNDELDYSGKLRDIEESMRAGWLSMAQQDLNTLKDAAPDLAQITGLESMLRERINNGNMLYDSIEQEFAQCHTEQAMQKLSELLSEWRDMEKAVELKKKVDLVSGEQQFVLLGLKSSDRIEVDLSGIEDTRIVNGMTLSAQSGVPLAADGNSFTILVPGASLTIDGHEYKVELVQ